jgi:phage N-6-adenine-methyltransferase
MSKILTIQHRQSLLPGMPATAAKDKLDELVALQVFVDAFIACQDRDRAHEAVEYKLRCQREYVIWRDGVVVPSRQLGKQPKPDGISAPKSQKGELPVNDPGDLTAHRWRKNLKDPVAYDRTVANSQIKVVSMLERGSIRQKDLAEFYTPGPIIELARTALGGIDLDPASCAQAQRIVKAARFFRKEDGALEQEWRGRVWLNPPFGRDIVPKFVEKLLQEIERKHVKAAILLVNNCTETKWFASAASCADAICFHTGRVTFNTPAGVHEVTQGQALLYWGKAIKRFIKEFSVVGWIAVPPIIGWISPGARI